MVCFFSTCVTDTPAGATEKHLLPRVGTVDRRQSWKKDRGPCENQYNDNDNNNDNNDNDNDSKRLLLRRHARSEGRTDTVSS